MISLYRNKKIPQTKSLGYFLGGEGEMVCRQTRIRRAQSKLLCAAFWRPSSRYALFHSARESRSYLNKTKIGLRIVLFLFWRRGGDSNSRYGKTAHRFSRAAPSTTQTPLLVGTCLQQLYSTTEVAFPDSHPRSRGIYKRGHGVCVDAPVIF